MGRHSCCTKQKLRKGLWSPEEDEKLFNYITRFGVGCWSSVPKLAGLQRCGKSCRLRWINYLRPDLKRGMFSQQEEDLIINLHKVLGNRWAQIAAQLPGRTDNEIKNLWNSSLKKKLIKQGINPSTHQPLKDQYSESSQSRKNDTVSHQPPPPNGQLLPPTIVAVKSEQPIFLLDDSTLNNNDHLQHHYGPGHFLIKHPFAEFSSEFEPERIPELGPGPTGINWALLATQDWQNGTQDHMAYGLFDLQSSEVEFSNPSNIVLPRVDSYSFNEVKESSSHSSIEMNSAGALSNCWDGIPGNCSKLEGLFDQYDYDDEDDHYNKKASNVVEFEDQKPSNPWLMERIGLDDQDEIQLSGSLKLISDELGNSNFDVFQHL